MSRSRPALIVGYPADRVHDQLVSHVRKRLPHDRVVILGESFAGPIAIEVAAADPRIVGLVLASSFARHPLPAQFAPLTKLLDAKWMPTRIIVAALMGSAATPELKEHLRRVLAALPREVIQARARDVSRKIGLSATISAVRGHPAAYPESSTASTEAGSKRSPDERSDIGGPPVR